MPSLANFNSMISLGRTSEAVQVLASTGTSAALSAAASVASSLSVSAREALVIRRRLGAQLLEEGKRTEARKLFSEHNMTASLLVASVGQTLTEVLAKGANSLLLSVLVQRCTLAELILLFCSKHRGRGRGV